MMTWVFAAITLASVLMATFVNDMRRAILSLWVAGLGVGAMYLTIGAEFLAIVQWIASTLVTIAFLFFAVMFGEYHSSPVVKNETGLLMKILSVGLGTAFAGLIWLGSHELEILPQSDTSAGSDLAMVGRVLTQDNLLSLEVLALTLFLVLVGGGVIARSERGD
jgi:NADH:ubiquinone oxidoreductase subunit 6 (subunit J)